MSKNIWIINQYTGSPYHGMNYRSYYLAREFSKKGDNVTIFTGSYSHLFYTYPKVKGDYTQEVIDGLNYVWVKTPKYKSSKSVGRMFNMLVFMFRLFLLDTSSFKKPDVIIISSLSLFPIVNAYLWSKKYGVKLIFEIRDLWPQSLIELGNLSPYHPLVLFFGFFEKFGYKKADRVVSLLINSKEYMVKRGLKEDKFVYIPNGIFLDEVKSLKPLSADIVNMLPKGKFLIGYVGTVGISNALDYLCGVAKELRDMKDIHFVIVGKGDKKDRLLKFCKENGLENITFIDPINKTEVQSMLKLFDVCYIGLKKEKLFRYGVSPNKLFDYMYASKPILYAIDSGKTNIVELAKCGIAVEAENIESIKEGILKLYNLSKEDLDKMGKNGYEYVMKNHTYGSLAKRYMEII